RGFADTNRTAVVLNFNDASNLSYHPKRAAAEPVLPRAQFRSSALPHPAERRLAPLARRRAARFRCVGRRDRRTQYFSIFRVMNWLLLVWPLSYQLPRGVVNPHTAEQNSR